MTTVKVYPARPRITDEYSAQGLPLHYWVFMSAASSTASNASLPAAEHEKGRDGSTTRAAVLVYVRYMADPVFEREPTGDELRLVVAYCEYFINAPCWVWPKYELRMLRQAIERVTCAHELANWLWGCGQIGIDPL